MRSRFRKIFFFLLFLISPAFSFSQGEWNNWYFGNKAGITFASGAPQAVFNNTVLILRSTISVSDSNGMFRFLTNGSTVWDKNFDQMPNGFGLNISGSSDQQSISIPFINDDSTYYIFTVDITLYPFIFQTYGLCYSILDLRLNNGLGDIVAGQKNIPVPGAFYASAL